MTPLQIAIPFRYDENWVGGVYYVENVLNALKLVPAAERPRITILSPDAASVDYLRSKAGYDDLAGAVPRDVLMLPAANWHARPAEWRAARHPIDVVLLGSMPRFAARAIQWVPDFQEKHFPAFFPPSEQAAREERNRKWFSSHRHVMVSSRAVEEDLHHFYREFGNVSHVVRFASFIDAGKAPDPASTARRYGLPARYFLCPNQLWQHKNHRTVIEAMRLWGEADAPPVVFTGLEADYRKPEFPATIKALAAELKVADRLKFLGFIPRDDQIALMRGALAVVQPSRCEGWSTVIEDAKACGQRVIASSLAVHREQIDRNVTFFEPLDAAALATALRCCAALPAPLQPFDLIGGRLRFAEALMSAIRAAAADFESRKVDVFAVTRSANRP